MREKFLTGLFMVLAIVLVLALLIVTNLQGYYHTMGELHDTLGEIGRAVGTGIQILFWTALAFAFGWLALWWRREHNVIRPDKHGPAQAVKYGREVIAVPQPVLVNTVSVGDEMKRALDMLSQMQRVAKQMGTVIAEERTIDADPTKQIPSPKPLPEFVRYEDVAPSIPKDHALVGIDGSGIVTRERGVKALIWIVGGSGSGKTNSACLRIEEDYQWGHWFLVIDPHWFKPDSLWNAIKGYQDRFIVPITGMEHPFASETQEVIAWLEDFIKEFKRRKAGGAWEFPITVVIEEIGSLVSDKTTDEDELYMRELIKTVTRICGQEGRNFHMTGMCISQDAAGLAWLRKRAVMVIAHKLVMMSERELACNENKEIARAMDEWPKGRALIYGIEFQGQHVYQQPVKKPRIVDASPSTEDLPRLFQPQQLASGQREAEVTQEANGEADGSNGSNQAAEITDLSVVKELREIGKRLKNGEDKAKIVKSYGLPYGRATQELSAAVEFVEQQLKQTGEL